MSNLILAGGGNSEQSLMVDQYYMNLLIEKEFLFIPAAISPELWPVEKALSWVKKPPAFKNTKITVCEDLIEFEKAITARSLYFMGGNTFKLLNSCFHGNVKENLRKYFASDAPVYGISAGAIIMGHDISTALTGPEKDDNYLHLTNLSSFNLLNGYNVAAHYIIESDSELASLSKKNPIIAIPEDSGLHITDLTCKVIGPGSVAVFRNGKKIYFQESERFEIL